MDTEVMVVYMPFAFPFPFVYIKAYFLPVVKRNLHFLKNNSTRVLTRTKKYDI